MVQAAGGPRGDDPGNRGESGSGPPGKGQVSRSGGAPGADVGRIGLVALSRFVWSERMLV